MFADDTKLWITLKLETDSATLHTDLDSLTAWSNWWLLKFNASKCKLMHIDHKFPTEYYMEDDADQWESEDRRDYNGKRLRHLHNK